MLLRIIPLLLLPFFIISCAEKQVKVLEERPIPSDNAYYQYILGYTAEKEGNWEDAIEYYNKALKEDPSSAYLKTQISSMLLRTGKVTEAISLAEEIIEKEPDYVPALMLLGEIYNSQNKM
jgi:predicted Zn-dependent protease